MLLNKKLFLVSIMLLLLLLPISYAQVCELGKVKDILRKILYLHFTGEADIVIKADEVKDLLIFYLTISSENITVDCSALGSRTNKPIFEFINLAENLPDKIPSCADSTKYGHCSANKPGYCYTGSVYSKCDLCGCPVNSRCGKSGKCDALAQNITCFKDLDCGQNDFIGDYYCTGNYISRNYTNYTCQNPGTVNSRCAAATGSVFLTYCAPTYNQICVAGKNTCQTTINDSAPTVSISVNPTTVAQGQFFNVSVTGTDDVGLAMIWWWAVNTTDAELNKAHLYGCNGARACAYSWLVSTNATGTLTLGANSRDTAYPVAGQPHQASEGQGIAYATVTITEPGTTAVSGLTIKGRLIDKFTLKPVANIAIFLGTSTTGQALNPIYTNANGEFAVSTLTNITSAKMFPYWPKCYQQGFFLLGKKSDGSLYINLYLFDLVKADKNFAVTGSEVNLGDIPLWPAVDIAVNSDLAVQMNIEYPEEERSYGNINYKTSHYLSNIVPLAYNARVQLKDQSGSIYYSPYKTYGLENGCAPVTLTFSSKQFIWSGAAQTNVSNISNCFVKIDGIIVKSVYATDRNDCYSKTSFGSENCKTYAPYFTDGVHFLEQYFGANDRVNNEYCTCTNGVCVQGNQTAQNVTTIQSNRSITVLSPNGGEVWYYNVTNQIYFKSSGIYSLGVQLLKGTQVVNSIAPNVIASSSVSFPTYNNNSIGYYLNSNIYSTVGSGSDYKIRLYDYDNPQIADESNAQFSLFLNKQTATCTDSDGGRNYYIKGTATGSINAYDTSTDFCSGNYVTESFCLNGIRYQESYLCSGGCSDGACVNQTTSKPDLIVSDITFSPANPTTADYTYAYFIIKNIGSATAWNFSTKVEHVGGQSYLFGTTGALQPGATTQPGYLSNYWPAGTRTFTATVDINNNVAELDENNNALTKSVTILSTTNQTTLKGYAETCTDGTECRYNLTCISDPLDNNVGKCGWWGSTGTFSQCSAGYYPSTPCQCGKMAIYAGACNHGIFYWPPTQAGSSVGSSCTDSTQCSTGICIFGKCSYAVRCHPQTPGYCHDHEECVAFGASC